jgi:hypothetical protein
MDSTSKIIIDLVTNIGIPFSILAAFAYWVGKVAFPKFIAVIEKLSNDFRQEMEKERAFHAENIKEFFATNDRQITRLENSMTSAHERIEAAIDRKVSSA